MTGPDGPAPPSLWAARPRRSGRPSAGRADAPDRKNPGQWTKIGRGKLTREQRATFERLRTSSAFRVSEGMSAKVILHRTNDPMEVAIGDRTWRVDPDGREERIVDPEGEV